MNLPPADTHRYQQARRARDARFDGVFFVAVVSTGIYCRPICPAPAPKEENVRYYGSAIEAASQGFRPCLRCRPDSAPGSPAWLGNQTTFKRALSLIQSGYLQEHSVSMLAEKLGVTDRYLRKLFMTSIGCSPKQYALYQQILFAKKLLHESALPVADIAFAAGFNSIRRFNDCFAKQLVLTPSQVRRLSNAPSDTLSLTLSFRPPYHWPAFHRFIALRLNPDVEWLSDNAYGRRFVHQGEEGRFTAHFEPEKNAFRVDITLGNPAHLYAVVNRIRRVLDLDANPKVIGDALRAAATEIDGMKSIEGIRIPGCWDMQEAMLRAYLGENLDSAATWHDESIESFQAAWQALNAHYSEPSTSLDTWPEATPIPQLSQAQYRYAKLRGLGDADVSFSSGHASDEHARPWRSYLALANADDATQCQPPHSKERS